MFERFSEKARRVIFYARYEAGMFGSHRIETEHILIALLKESGSDWKSLLGDIDADSIRREIGSYVDAASRLSTKVELPLSVESKQVISLSVEEADRLNQRPIGTKHLLLGLLLIDNCRGTQILKARGVAVEETLEALRSRKEPD